MPTSLTPVGSEAFNPNALDNEPTQAISPGTTPRIERLEPEQQEPQNAPKPSAQVPELPAPKPATDKKKVTPTEPAPAEKVAPPTSPGKPCGCTKRPDETAPAATQNSAETARDANLELSKNTGAPTQKSTRSRPTADQLAGRRKVAMQALVAVAAGAALLLWMQPWANVTNTAESAITTTSAASTELTANDQVTADLIYAEEYLAQNGTLDGIIIQGAQLAVRDTTMYAVRNVAGQCTVYGLLSGQRIAPVPDTTGAACAGQIVTVQAQLDAAAAQVTAHATQTAEATLKTATAAAAAYAQRNFVQGTPSMTGLPTTLAGATVTENTGDYVRLRAAYPEACLESYVTAAGEIGDLNSCA